MTFGSKMGFVFNPDNQTDSETKKNNLKIISPTFLNTIN